MRKLRSSKGTRGGWRRFRRRAAIAVVSLVAVLGLSVAFRGPILRRAVLPWALGRLRADLGIEATVRGLHLSLGGVLTVTGIEARGGPAVAGLRALSADRVRVELSPGELLRGKGLSWLERVSIDGLRLSVDPTVGPVLPETGRGAGEPAAFEGPLPEVILRDAGVVVATGEGAVEAGGVEVSHSDGALRVFVARIAGDLDALRSKAIRPPLEVEARLAGRGSPWDEFRVGTARLGGREILRDAAVVLEPAGGVRLSGSFPEWSLRVPEASVGGDLVRVRFVLEGTRVDELWRLAAPFLPDAPVHASCFGEASASFPPGDPAAVVGEVSLELHDAFAPDLEAGASTVAVTCRTDGRGRLRGDLLAVGVLRSGLRPSDAIAAFAVELEAPAGPRVEVSRLLLLRPGLAVDAACILRAGDATIESAWASAADVDPSAFADVAPGIEEVRATASVEAWGRGRADDPSSWEGWGRVEGTADLGGAQGRVELSLSAGLSPELSIRLDDLRGTVLCEPFRLLAPASVRLDGGGVRVEPLRLAALGGAVEASVSVDAAGNADGCVIVDGASLSALGAVAGDRSVRPGWLDLALVVSRDSTEESLLTSAEGRVDIRSAEVAFGASRIEGAGATLDVSLSGDRVRGAARLEGPWARVDMEGSVLLDPSRSAEVAFRAEVPDVGRLPLGTGAFREMGGRLQVAGIARTSPPTFDATVLVENGVGRFYGDLPSIVDVGAELRIRDDRVTVERLAGRLGSSDFQVGGSARIDGPWNGAVAALGEADLSLRSKGVLLVRRPELRVRGDLALRLHGPGDRLSLDGSATITRAYYLQDIAMVPGRGAGVPVGLFSIAAPPFDTMRLGVRVLSTRGIQVQNNLVSTRASADLALSGTGRYPILTGYVTSDEGRVVVGNQSLDIESAVVEFRAADPLNPGLRVLLDRRLRGYDIDVALTGTAQAPQVFLESSPPLDRDALAILIMTGMTPSEISDKGTGEVAATQAALYLGKQLAAQLSARDPTRERSFLDDVSIESESAPRGGYSDPLRVEYRIVEDFPFRSAELFLQGERDMYSDYNLSAGIRFELK